MVTNQYFLIAIVGTLGWYFYASFNLLPESVPEKKISTKLFGIVQTVHRDGRLDRLIYWMHDSCNIIQNKVPKLPNLPTFLTASRSILCVHIYWRFAASLICASHRPLNVERVEPRSD
jgi:hypothetical protein